MPNPTQRNTRIAFHLGQAGTAQVMVFDVRGRLVRVLRDGWLPAGNQVVDWDGRNIAGEPVVSGVYHVRVSALGEVQSKSIAILK